MRSNSFCFYCFFNVCFNFFFFLDSLLHFKLQTISNSQSNVKIKLQTTHETRLKEMKRRKEREKEKNDFICLMMEFSIAWTPKEKINRWSNGRSLYSISFRKHTTKNGIIQKIKLKNLNENALIKTLPHQLVS